MGHDRNVDPLEVHVALVDLLARPSWHADAACREHPELSFFPERGEPVHEQRAVCSRCLVRVECLAAALDRGYIEPGMWGGTSSRERRLLLSHGVAAADAATWLSERTEARQAA